MAEKSGNKAYVFLANFDGERSANRVRGLTSLRNRGSDIAVTEEVGGRAAWMFKSFLADIWSFLSWRSTSHNMCKNYGHVFDRRNSHFENKCTECGARINSLEDVRGCRSAITSKGKDSRSVIKW